MKGAFIKKLLHQEAGLSLMELVVVMVTTSIIIAATMPLFRAQTESYIMVRSGKKLIQETRIGMNRLVAELRCVPSSDYIDYGYSDAIRFDVPSLGLYNCKYELISGCLTREGSRLIDGVQTFRLTYYAADGTQLSTPFWYSSSVWRIKIYLVVGDEDNQFVLERQVSPRNFHY